MSPRAFLTQRGLEAPSPPHRERWPGVRGARSRNSLSLTFSPMGRERPRTCVLKGTMKPGPVCHFQFWTICLLLAVAIASLTGCTVGGDALPEGTTPAVSIQRRIAYGSTVENLTGRAVRGAELWVRAPVKRTATQRCDRIETSQPHELLTDGLGNQVLRFTFGTIPPYGSRLITIRASLFLSDTPGPMEAAELRRFLQPEPWIESGEAPIIRLIQTIKGRHGHSGPGEIFRWITENIASAGYTRGDRGALHCLAQRRGDCTEQACLFAALCRAAGIPARVVGGWVCEEDRVLSAADHHDWAEVHGAGVWHVADPQGRVLMTKPSRYIAMHIRGGPDEPGRIGMTGFRRFRIVGEGLKAWMH